ncbi:hypothetical protein A5709_04940 [Mycobacterium sp. E1386]|uniref:hypothetical protein n=1 Tax=Mycobacterium sp. E1386 TaxID=1834126 RepID=UPI0008019BEC|nr:hypothetical protein [Mycobacterium sp. E1386]OBI27644.1 hypothetical protein A5709_04940 [Mycobacterium sp. E1386]
MVIAKALSEIDLLIAKCCVDIVGASSSGSGSGSGSGQRSYEMVTTPVRLDTLSGDPWMVIRSTGSVERTHLVVSVRFQVADRFRQCTFTFHHDFGDVCLTAQSPVATRQLPLGRFRPNRY